MKTAPVPAALIAASAALAGLTCASSTHAAAATAPPRDSTDPFQVSVFAGGAHDDNLFRQESEAAAEEVLGTDQLEDWYRYVGAGFTSNYAGDRQRFQVDGDIFRQTYDEFDFLDYTGGHLNADGEWELSGTTTGLLGYGYRRRLQSFTNKDSLDQDIVQTHSVTGGIEQALGERWQLRVVGDWADLDFSSSEFLNKKIFGGEAEIRYAASQNSIFGLLASYTESRFDTNDANDFSGWSVGPSFEWQITSSLELSANFGYTHRGLDESGGALEDFDGMTGYVATLWQPGERFASELRIFRDISNLGGEVTEYTELTGIRWSPTWQITPKLSTRFDVTFEERDFASVEGLEDRQDDYLLAELWLDFDVTQRLLLSLGYGYEDRSSNEDDEEFDANVVRGEVRFTF